MATWAAWLKREAGGKRPSWRALAAAVAAMLLVAGPPWLPTIGATDDPTLGGPFELVDHNGRTRTDVDFRGSYLLLYFGFTACPDLCPTTLAVMGQAIDDLAVRAPRKAVQVVPLFITVDPARDTVDILKSYVRSFHPRLIGLTGTAEQIDQVARSYGVFYAPVPMAGGDYMMDHSGFILLMGPDGEYITHFEPSVAPADLAAELERRIGE